MAKRKRPSTVGTRNLPSELRAADGVVTFAKVFALIARKLPPELCSRQSKAQLAALCQRLPLTSGVILESRLGDRTRAIDFSARIMIEDRSCQRFLAQTPYHWRRHKTWAAFLQMCEYLVECRSPLNSAVETLWLEFDAHTQQRSVPLPCIFFDWHGSRQQLLDKALYEILRLFGLSGTKAREWQTRASRVLGDLGEPLSIHSIGMMTSRRPCVLRVNVEIPLNQLAACDDSIVNPAVVGHLDDIMRNLEHDSTLVLGWDIGADAEKSLLHVEIKQTQNAQLEKLLTALVSAGHCSPQKAKAARAWPNECGDKADDLSLIPHGCIDADNTCCSTRLNHVKVTVDASGIRAAKLYLYMGYGWRLTGGG